MAKIIGKPLFLGTIGDLTFYERMGKFFVRQKADLGKKEIMTQPNRRRQRENMNGFGGASSFAAAIRHAWKEMGNIAMDATTIPRLNSVMYAIQRAGEGIRGYQSIQLSRYGERLTGFTLGENRSPAGHFSHSPEWQLIPPVTPNEVFGPQTTPQTNPLPSVTSSGAFGPLIEPNISPNAEPRGLKKRVSKQDSTPKISPNAEPRGFKKRVSKPKTTPKISPNAKSSGLANQVSPPHTSPNPHSQAYNHSAPPPHKIRLTFPAETRLTRKKAPRKAKYYAIHLHVTALSDRHWDEGSEKFEPAHPAGSNSTACLCTNPIPLTTTLTLPDSLCLTLPASAQPGQNLIITWGIEYFAEENGQPKPIIISKPDSRCRQTETYCEVLAVTVIPHPPQTRSEKITQSEKISSSAKTTRSAEIPISALKIFHGGQRGARNSISATQKAKHSPKGDPTPQAKPTGHQAPPDQHPAPQNATAHFTPVTVQSMQELISLNSCQPQFIDSGKRNHSENETYLLPGGDLPVIHHVWELHNPQRCKPHPQHQGEAHPRAVAGQNHPPDPHCAFWAKGLFRCAHGFGGEMEGAGLYGLL